MWRPVAGAVLVACVCFPVPSNACRWAGTHMPAFESIPACSSRRPACRPLRLRGAGDIRQDTVEIYIHGTLERPASEETRDLINILRRLGIEFVAHDITADQRMRERLTQLHNWKIFPQMHVNGRLLGDYTIVKELDADGEFMSELAAFRKMPPLFDGSAGLHPNAAQRDAAVAAWKSVTQQAPGDDDDMVIDEREVLADEALGGVQAQQAGCDSDGRKKKRKACKNCSCGLAQELAAGKDGSGEAGTGADAGKSACGSCYLGDAFRCETCPYKGLPPFKPGEKVALAPVDDL